MYLQVIYYPKMYFAIILSYSDSDLVPPNPVDSTLCVLYLTRCGLNISPPLASLSHSLMPLGGRCGGHVF